MELVWEAALVWEEVEEPLLCLLQDTFRLAVAVAMHAAAVERLVVELWAMAADRLLPAEPLVKPNLNSLDQDVDL